MAYIRRDSGSSSGVVRCGAAAPDVDSSSDSSGGDAPIASTSSVDYGALGAQHHHHHTSDDDGDNVDELKLERDAFAVGVQQERAAYEELSNRYEQLSSAYHVVQQQRDELHARLDKMHDLVRVSFRVEHKLERFVSALPSERWPRLVTELLRRGAFYNTALAGYVPVAGFWLARLVRFWGWAESVEPLTNALSTHIVERLLQPVERAQHDYSDDLRKQLAYAAASLALLGSLAARAEQYSLLDVGSAGASTRRLSSQRLHARIEPLFAQLMRALCKHPAETLAQHACDVLLLRGDASAACEPVPAVETLCATLARMRETLCEQCTFPRPLARQVVRNVLVRLDDHVVHRLLHDRSAYSAELGAHLMCACTLVQEHFDAHPLARLEQVARVLLMSQKRTLLDADVREQVCPLLSDSELAHVVRHARDVDPSTHLAFDALLHKSSVSPRDEVIARWSRLAIPTLSLLQPSRNHLGVPATPQFDMSEAYTLTHDEFQTLPALTEWLKWFE